MPRCVIAFFTLVLSSAAFAVPVTWEFSGTVAITNVNGGMYWTDAGVSAGDRLSGNVTFDPDAAFAAAATFPVPPSIGGGGTAIWTPNSTNPAFADFGAIVISRVGTGLGDLVYDPARSSDAIYRERTTLDTLFFATVFPQTNNLPIDTFSIDTYDKVAPNTFGRFQIFRLVAQPAGNGVIPSDRFLSTPPGIADLLFAVFSMEEFDTQGLSSVIATQLDSIHRVPEPGTLSLLAAGLFGLAFLRRRRAA
jgi:hypothetical protein